LGTTLWRTNLTLAMHFTVRDVRNDVPRRLKMSIGGDFLPRMATFNATEVFRQRACML
jgi:hypothetical protein